MDVRGRTRDVVQQRLPRQPVVTVWIVRRHIALIPPEDVYGWPRDLISEFRCQQAVERAWSVSARQHEGASACVSNRVVERADCGFSRAQAQLAQVGKYAHIRSHVVLHNAKTFLP